MRANESWGVVVHVECSCWMHRDKIRPQLWTIFGGSFEMGKPVTSSVFMQPPKAASPEKIGSVRVNSCIALHNISRCVLLLKVWQCCALNTFMHSTDQHWVRPQNIFFVFLSITRPIIFYPYILINRCCCWAFPILTEDWKPEKKDSSWKGVWHFFRTKRGMLVVQNRLTGNFW